MSEKLDALSYLVHFEDDLLPAIENPEKIEEIAFNKFENGDNKAVDYVIVYECDNNENICDDDGFAEINQENNKINKCRSFLRNLKKKGLEFEIDNIKCQDKSVKIIKIHVSFETLTTYAEEMEFKVPIKAHYAIEEDSFSVKMIKKLHLPDIFSPIDTDSKKVEYYTALFRKSKIGKYIPSTLYPVYFTCVQRQAVALEILLTTDFGNHENYEYGIEKLINEEVFSDFYPEHDGGIEENECKDGVLNYRAFLYKYWARFRNWYKRQPLDNIKNYLGEKIAFYFAWLGVYTSCLLFPAFVGLCVLIYNLIFRTNDETITEICELGRNIVMCPISINGNFWNLSDMCLLAKINSLFNNPTTLFFAFFMNLWTIFFLEYWRQKNISLAYRWDCFEVIEDERPRIDFAKKATSLEKNQITGKIEPSFPAYKRHLRMFISFLVFLLMIYLIVVLQIGNILMRTILNVKLFKIDAVSQYAFLISSILTGVINLVIVVILGIIYNKLANLLTSWEMHKTQSEHENNLILKIFPFEYFNFYFVIFYLAFIKGRFIGYPGNYTTFFGYRLEQCANGECMFELTQQMAIYMIGVQFIGNISETNLPKIFTWLRKKSLKVDPSEKKTRSVKEFEKMNFDGLFNEYSEMILQFSFISSFVPALPIAPLFAAINNWIEIRTDAKKLICTYRRPPAEKVQGIGLWEDILSILVRWSVIINAFLIAFTTDIIPKFMYQYQNNNSLVGYTEFALSYSPPGAFNQTCRYKDFRDINGNLTEVYYELIGLRLTFVLVYVFLIYVAANIIIKLVPGVPKELDIKIRRERYWTKKAVKSALNE